TRAALGAKQLQRPSCSKLHYRRCPRICLLYAGEKLHCARIARMSQAAQAITRPPAEVVRETPVSQASNGICYAISGEMNLTASDVDLMVSAVSGSIAGDRERKAYYFVSHIGTKC